MLIPGIIAAQAGGGGVIPPPAFMGALVRRSADSAAVTHNATQTPGWATEVYDEGGWFDAGTSTTRFVVPSGVTHVRVHANIEMEATTDILSMAVFLIKNGGAVPVGLTQFRNSASGFTNNSAYCTTPVIAVSPGDYFEVQLLYSRTTSNRIILNTVRTWFAIEAVEDGSSFRGALGVRSSDATSLTFPVAPVVYNTQIYDTDGIFDPTTGLMTIPSGVSRVQMIAGVTVPNNVAAGTLLVTIQETTGPTETYNSPVGHRNNGSGGFTDNVAMSVTPVIDVTPGQVFQVRANVNGLGAPTSILLADTTFFGLRVVE